MDALETALNSGDVPELARMASEGGRYAITTVFPSVTGVAYVPLLTGRFPGSVGIPGLRWYDRERRLSWWLGHSRSYVGAQLRAIDRDLRPEARTLADHIPGSLGAQTMLSRGLTRPNQLDRGLRVAVAATRAHFAGDPQRWGRMEEDMAGRFLSRLVRDRPRFAFMAFTTGDKAAHRAGATSPAARRSLQLVDSVVGRIRRAAESGGWWRRLHLWVVSDHGHDPVSGHFDLAAALRDAGLRIRSHPWTFPDRSEAAVMVSGNSMAHIYLDLASRQRVSGNLFRKEWFPRIRDVLENHAMDLMVTHLADGSVEVTKPGQGSAIIRGNGGRWWYEPRSADPLELGSMLGVSPAEAHERSRDGAYPDAVVQLGSLMQSSRSGDVVLASVRGWDLRRAWEPIPHVSSHGALHRSHMLVPFLASRKVAGIPRRTADLFPSALQLLGMERPASLDGSSFLQDDPN